MSDSKRQADARMVDELRKLQGDLIENWIDRSLPEGWNGLETTAPMPRPKEKVTLRLDQDMIRWFRKLGPGYGGRINMVLRLYWEALVSGRIRSHWDETQVAPPFLDLVERLAREGHDGER